MSRELTVTVPALEAVDTTDTSAPTRRRATATLARLLGCTEGQLYTMVISLVVVGVMVIAGVPAAMRDRASRVVVAPERRVLGGESRPVAPPLDSTAGLAPLIAPVSQDAFVAPTEPMPSLALSPTRPAPFGTVTQFAGLASTGAPAAVAVSPDGLVYVSAGAPGGAATPSQIIAYDAFGAVARRYPVSGQPAGATRGLAAIALDGHDGLLALDLAPSPPVVLRFDLTSGKQSTLSAIADLSPCYLVLASNCEPGVVDHPPTPRGLAFDGLGGLYVTDAGQATIWKLPSAGGTAAPWYQSLDFAAGDGPAQLAVSKAGDVIFSVGASFDNANGPGVYRLAVSPSGVPGNRTLLAKLAANDAPDGVALGASDLVYVALRGANAIVVLNADGTEKRRAASESIDGPAGIAFRGTSLLVANGSPTNHKWAVLDVAVEDTGAPIYEG